MRGSASSHQGGQAKRAVMLKALSILPHVVCFVLFFFSWNINFWVINSGTVGCFKKHAATKVDFHKWIHMF